MRTGLRFGRIFLFSLLLPTLAAAPQEAAQGTASELSIVPFLSQLPPYRTRLLQARTALQENTRLGVFQTAVLQEAVLLSYSVWNVEEAAGQRLRLDCYELLDPAGAFSLFSLWPDQSGRKLGRPVALAVDNYYHPEASIFWRGNYFFQVVGIEPEGLEESTFRNLAERLVEVLPLINLKPVTVVHLPEEGLVPESIRFYLGPASLSLNPEFPEPLRGAVGLEDDIEITFARYHPAPSQLFLIGYPTPALAEDYAGRIQARLQDYISPQGIYLKRSGLLICLFSGPEVEARRVLNLVKYDPKVQWIYRKEEPPHRESIGGFLDLVRRTLIGIGFFLLVTLTGGIIVGLLRYEILRRFPRLTTRDEMIRLKLYDE